MYLNREEICIGVIQQCLAIQTGAIEQKGGLLPDTLINIVFSAQKNI